MTWKTAEELGLIMTEGRAGLTPQEIAQRGICSCGHRVSKHRQTSRGVLCQGVPKGRRLSRTMDETDCRCSVIDPVIVVADVRPFQASWRSALPEHPFTYGLRRVGLEKVTAWLVDTPLVCAACGGVGGGVRMVYQGGSGRSVSGFVCQACRPDTGGGE